jgi:hypothetical protein
VSAAADADAVAADLRRAAFVRILARPDGDALVAGGSLARALREVGVPFQVRVTVESAPERGDAVTVRIGRGLETTTDDGAAGTLVLADDPASLAAYAVAGELGVTPDPVVTLAGVAAAGTDPSADEADHVRAAAGDQVQQRPGLAAPTGDVTDGLAHTTLTHAPFSGDREQATEATAALGLRDDDTVDEAAHRRVGSLVAIETAGAEGATVRAATAVERALHPHETGAGAPFATVEGFGDVLEAVARERPGAGVALALGTASEGARSAALEAWRGHAVAAHAAVEAAAVGRHEGFVLARVEGVAPARLPTVARLVCDFRSPEPVAVVVAAGVGTDGSERQDGPTVAAASATPCGLGAAVETAASAVGGAGGGSDRRAHARLGPDADERAFVDALRGVL